MADDNESYKKIIKSTSIIGGSQVFTIILGIFRTKVVAILLGPTGVGIVGILQTIIDMVRNATGFGINFSGVKYIAEAAGTDDLYKISKTVNVLKKWALATGLLGMFITIIFCIPFSKYSFGNNSYAINIAILSIVLLISSVSSAQLALLQGLRMIGKMAKATLYGSILGTAITLPLYWWLGIKGIVPGLILTAFGSLIISWLFTKDIKVEIVKYTLKESFLSGLNMAKLGFFIVINGFIATASMYVIRALVMSKLGLDSVGFFQAVMTISTLYLGILLNSMLADFFPRLSMINTDNNASNKLINEQLELTLLVGTPMILGIITFSTLIIHLLYSTSFSPAIPVLQWQIAASLMTLISWPLGVMFLAKDKGKYAIMTETIKQLIFIAFVFMFFDYFGLKVLGIGFFIASFVNMLLVIPSVRYLGDFRFSKTNMYYIIIGCISVLTVLLSSLFIESNLIKYTINIMLCLVIIIVYVRRIDKFLNIMGLVSKLISKK